jgi:hypothetical protein
MSVGEAKSKVALLLCNGDGSREYPRASSPVLSEFRAQGMGAGIASGATRDRYRDRHRVTVM